MKIDIKQTKNDVR